MKLLIEKKSGRKFPPPFSTSDGKTAVAVGIQENTKDPKHRNAYVLDNGFLVNCSVCKVIKNLE